MNIISYLSLLKDFIEIENNQCYNFPEDVIELNKFEINNIENNTCYFIETSPNTHNKINYDGVKIGLKLYFELLKKGIDKFRIVLCGFENEATFFKDCEYSMFLKCEGVKYFQIGINYKKELKKLIATDNIDTERAIEQLKNINIKPPTSYKTHHSIANEWALYRWSKYLGIQNEVLQKLNNEIKQSLYYNYLQVIYSISKTENKRYIIPKDGKIMLVDDEVEKGWDNFFKQLFSSTIKFKAIGYNFKNINPDEIITETINAIKEFDPDLVILDLRLHDDDFNSNTKNLTGIEVLKEIKEHNNGIQVLGFSASNKIWNYVEMQDIGIDGFVVKESPENSMDKYFTKSSIGTLIGNINKALSKKYLKEICKNITKINEDLRNSNLKNLAVEIENQLTISYNLLKNAKTETQFAYSYISLYMIIEMINNEYVEKVDGSKWEIQDTGNLLDWKWSKEERKYTNLDEEVISNKPPEWQKFAGIYFQKYDLEDSSFIKELYSFITKRNGFVHNDKSIIEKRNIQGKYINKDIFDESGYNKLFKHIKEIIDSVLVSR